MIAITHDDAYFHLADRLIKVEQGQIAETVVKKSAVSEASFAEPEFAVASI